MRRSIIILTNQRSGSNFLGELLELNGLLNASEAVTRADDSFLKKHFSFIDSSKYTSLQNSKSPFKNSVAIVNDFFEKSEKSTIVFKFHGNLIKNIPPKDIVQFFKNDVWGMTSIINLERKDINLQSASLYLALNSGKWTSKTLTTDPILEEETFSLNYCKNDLLSGVHFNTLVLKQLKLPYYQLFYEELTENTLNELSNLFNFLNIKTPSRLITETKRCKIQRKAINFTLSNKLND